MSESFTCPRCHRTSHNPHDVKEGYCGNCHDWTGIPIRTHGDCYMCADDASKYNHCSFCGVTFETVEKLANHLDEHV